MYNNEKKNYLQYNIEKRKRERGGEKVGKIILNNS